MADVTRSYTIDLSTAGNAAAQLQALATALQGLGQQAGQATQAVNQVGQGSQGAAGGVQGLVTAMSGMAAAGLVMREAREVIDAIADGLEKARKFAEDTAAANLKLRDTMRELKFIREGTPEAETYAQDVLKLSVQSGMTAQEATNYLQINEAATGSLAKGVRPSADVLKAMQLEGARLGVSSKMDPATIGRLVGILPQYGGRITTAEQGEDRLAKIANQLGKRGVATFQQLMPAFAGGLGSMVEQGDQDEGARIGKAEDLAAIFGVATLSFKSPAQTMTGIRQANRMLRRFSGQTGEALGTMGVTPQMDFMHALRQIAPVAAGPDADLKLAGMGFANATERESVIKLAKALPAINQALAENEAPGQGRQMVEAGREFVRRDETGRVAEAEAFAAKDIAGEAGKEQLKARTRAQARMTVGGRFGTALSSVGDLLGDVTHAGLGIGSFVGPSTERRRIDEESIETLIKEGDRVGVDVRGRFGFMDRNRRLSELAGPSIFGLGLHALDAGGEEGRRGRFREAAEAIRAGGGDPTGGGGEVMRKLDEAADKLITAGNALHPPAAGPRPPAAQQPVVPRRT